MKILILAAGKGSRMGQLTTDTPKCMVKFLGRPIIEYNLDMFNKHALVDKIVTIRGYLSEQIAYSNIEYYDILQSHNMVETLFFAKDELNEDLIILYGDIIVSKENIDLLINSPNDISVLIDKNWKELQELRFKNISDDLESCAINHDGNIINIGAKYPKVDDVMGQYFGGIKLSKQGCAIFKSFYEQEKNKETPNRAWMRGRDFNSIYMTDFLQGLIDDGHKIKAIMCNKGWLEFDSEEDINCYTVLNTAKRLNEFIQL
jgi:choline kinase